MRKFEIEDAVIKIKWDLRRLGLDFPVDRIEDEDGDTAVVVQYGEGIFGKKIETLDKYFNHDLFMMFFKGRLNYLKLTAEERANITIHPQEWERSFLAS
tara:strand:- start:631 stop:927 length:297 start_codon:yes stop_codon:yes gene_type:complete